MRTAKAAIYEAPNTPFIIKDYPLRPAKRGRGAGENHDVDDLPV